VDAEKPSGYGILSYNRRDDAEGVPAYLQHPL